MNSISKTLYIPLLGNIRTSKICPELFFDQKILELEKEIPKNIKNKKSPNYFYFAGATRYFAIDKEVRKFIKKHPNCNIVNLGAGLDTTFYRMKNKTAIFYELDLKPVIQKRKQLLGQGENEIFIQESFLEVKKWTDQIIDKNKPTLLIASGLFYYFKKEQISKFLADIKGVFKHAELVFDCVDQKGVKISNRFVQKTGNNSAPMYFYINDIKKFLKNLDVKIELIEEYMYYRDTKEIIRKNGFYLSYLIMLFSDLVKRVRIEHLKID